MNKKHRSLRLEKIGSFLILLSFLVSPLQAQDQKVQATVTSNQVSVGQPLVYKITVESDESGSVGEPRLPDLEGFELVNRTQGMEARSEFVNGKFSFVRKQVYSYQLRPKKPGELVIGKAEVVVGEKTFTTQPIRISVKAGPAGSLAQEEEVDDVSEWDAADEMFNQLLKRAIPQAQEIPDLNDKEAFFIRVELDKKKVFAGEQITASWYLYTQNTLTNFEPIKYPDLKGFWKEDIEIATRLNFQTEVVNGIPYRKALLVSYALFPIKPGTATIDSYKLRASALMANPLSAFGKPYTFTKTNPPVKIEVQPLPPGQPEDFNGAVGQFQMTAKVDKSQVPANEPFSLKVRLEGRGNAKQVELPTLSLPQEFETFDTKSDSKFSKDGSSYKEFEVLIIPRKEGKLTIPSISMSYFNPATRKYERTQTQAIEMSVGAGKNLNLTGANPLDLSGEMRQEKKLVLPGPALEIPQNYWSVAVEKSIYAISTLIFCLGLLLVGMKEFRTTSENEALLKQVAIRLKTISQSHKKNAYKEAGVQVINLVDYVLTELTKSTESHSLDVLLEKLPPSLQEYYKNSFRTSVQYFETLGFAPEEISKSLMNEDRFDKELKIVKDSLLESIKKFGRATS